MIQKRKLQEASLFACEIWLAETEAGYEPDHPCAFSYEFEQNMKKMMNGYGTTGMSAGKRCMAFVFWLVFLCSLLLAVNKEVRACFTGWLKEQTGQVMIYRSLVQQDTQTLPDYRLRWIPEGYGDQKIVDHEHERTVFYENEQGQRLIFSYMDNSGSGTWFVSLESMTVRKVNVNGVSADLLISSNPDVSSALMWVSEDRKTAFCVEAFLSEDELIRLAESVVM